MRRKGISYRRSINCRDNGEEPCCSKKKSFRKINEESHKYSTPSSNIFKSIKKLQTDLNDLKRSRKNELKEEEKLLKQLEGLATNVKSEIQQLQPIKLHHLQQFEERSLRRDFIMLLLAITIPIIIERLLHLLL
jgi:hypothetical protein